MNFIKFYIGDYLRDTGTLTLAQHGAYVLMLLEHYATEKPLPTGRELHRLLRADSKQERDAVDFIAAKFWTLSDGGLINARSTKEFARADDVSEKNRAIALAREAQKRARTEHEQSTKRAQNVPRKEHEQSTNQTPDTRHQKENGGIPPEPPARVRAREADPTPLPPWVDATAWDGYEAMRKAARKPMTPAARRLAVAELAKLRDSGHDPTEVLRQSTFRSWVGLFPIKAEHANGSEVGAMSPHGLQTMRNAEALKARLFRDVEAT